MSWFDDAFGPAKSLKNAVKCFTLIVRFACHRS